MSLNFVRPLARAGVVLSLVFATPAFAQKWEQVSSDSTATYHVDKASISRSGNLATVTSRSDYIGDGVQKGVVRRVYNEVFDCSKPAVKLRKMTLYGEDGTVLNEFEWGEGEMDWIPLSSGSLGAIKAKAVCG